MSRIRILMLFVLISCFGFRSANSFNCIINTLDYLKIIGVLNLSVNAAEELNDNNNLQSTNTSKNIKSSNAIKQKILYINSYHKGYVWSDGIEDGLLKALNITENEDGSYNTLNSSVELKTFRMDTKNNNSKEFINKAVNMAREVIRSWQPDIVVVSDDNGSKYLVSEYYINSTIPFVFCGVNVDPKLYGFGGNNVTGMTEVEFFGEVIELLKPFAKGDRIGYIGSDTLTERHVVNTIANDLGISFTGSKLVSTFKEWKDAYKRLQEAVDMIIWLSPIGIKGWNQKEAVQFVKMHTSVPSGTTINAAISLSLISKIKLAEEQGWWAGKTALKILDGVNPAEITITRNKQSRLYLNMDLAKVLDIVFPMKLIEESTFVNEEKE